MSDAPLPEDIRGAWYFLDGTVSAADALGGDFDVISLRFDGDFDRWTVGENGIEDVDHGDYTFDGNFLILRGDNTNTYRVDVRSEVEWFLEGKKEDRRMLRTRQNPADVRHLTEDELDSIRTRPARVVARHAGDDDTAPLAELAFERSGGDDLPIGSIAAEEVGDGTHWIGITSLVDNVPDGLWEDIVEKSYFDAACGGPDDVGEVVVEVIGSDVRFDFEYKG